MKLSEFKSHVNDMHELNFHLPNGTIIPAHFHITEAGLNSRHFIDCGGTVRTENLVSMQIWVAADTDHRLSPSKLLKILDSSAPIIGTSDHELELEYQGETIGRYGIEFHNGSFALTPKHTDCLAKDHCGIPTEKLNNHLSTLVAQPAACCAPGGTCC